MDYQYRFFCAIFVLCAIVFVNGAPPQKIVGGSNAVRGEFPYIVSLRKNGRHFCGGAIISERHILTAAHCVKGQMDLNDLSNIRVVTGTEKLYTNAGETHKIVKAKYHPGYSLQERGVPDDIAVLTLASPIKFNEYQKKVNLPYRDFIDGTQASIAGWGYTSSYLKLASQSLKKVFPKVTHCRIGVATKLRVCGNHETGQDTCQGDSGGPLVIGNEVIGVVSWGAEICGSGSPDVYTNVLLYKDFIRDQMFDLYA